MQDFVSIKEQIRTRVDLVEFVSEHTALKRQGRNYVGLCPFHQEKTPSFSVNSERQFFKCFGCGAGGDVFTFLQLRESVDFREAVRILADRAGVELEPAGPARSDRSSRADIGRINEWACKFFAKRLQEPNLGESARKYVQHRGISPEMVARFGIGLATGGSSSLLRAALSAGFSRKLLVDSGLCKTSEDRGTQDDTFRDRLMFPIRDAMKRCVGFGGRTLVDAAAKYLNTPQTALFDKSNSLYGLDLARQTIIETKQAILVEGYTDCIAAHQHGFPNTVATLGTAATDAHMSALRRYCDTVVLVFDSDAAGEAAADRALAVGLKHNLAVRLAQIPDHKDPGEYLQTIGTKGFSSVLNSAQDALTFRWNRIRQRYGGDESAASRREAVSEFVTLVAELAQFGILDAIQQGVVAAQLANLLSVPTPQVHRLLAGRASAAKRSTPVSGLERAKVGRPRDAEQAALVTILEVLVNEPGFFDRVADVFLPERFSDPAYRRIAERICELTDSAGAVSFSELLSGAGDTNEAEILTDLATRDSCIVNLEAGLECAKQDLLRVSDAHRTGRLTDEFKQLDVKARPKDAAQRERLAQVSRRLKARRRYTHQRAIHECGGAGGHHNRSEEDLGK